MENFQGENNSTLIKIELRRIYNIQRFRKPPIVATYSRNLILEIYLSNNG
jgi:hypothetical protein